MYPHSRLHDICELEVFVFGGVPESPEPVYGRDGSDYSEGRTTRAGLGQVNHQKDSDEETIIVEVVRLDLRSNQLTFGNPVSSTEDAR